MVKLISITSEFQKQSHTSPANTDYYYIFNERYCICYIVPKNMTV